MKHWNATKAKRHFSELLDESQKEPQVIENRGKPIGVMISYEKFKNTPEVQREKLLSTWLEELREINLTEGDMEDIVRTDRAEPGWE